MLVAGVGGLGMLQGKFSCLGCIQTSLSLGVLSLGREEQSVPLPTACLTVRCEMPHLLGPCPLTLGSPGPKQALKTGEVGLCSGSDGRAICKRAASGEAEKRSPPFLPQVTCLEAPLTTGGGWRQGKVAARAGG